MALVPVPDMDKVNDLCLRMAVDDTNEGGAIFDEDDVPEDAGDLQWCFLGKFMTEKSIHFQSMQNTLAAV